MNLVVIRRPPIPPVVEAALERDALGEGQRREDLLAVLLVQIGDDLDGVSDRARRPTSRSARWDRFQISVADCFVDFRRAHQSIIGGPSR
jgi:hypothetical protein